MLTQFLPENLNLAKLLQTNPPSFKYHHDYFTHILSLLVEVPSKRVDLIDKYGFVPLNADILKSRVRNYKLYLDYLEKAGVIEINKKYYAGVRSRGYRYAAKYRTMIAPAGIEKYTLLKKIRHRSDYDRCMQAKYHWLHKWLDGRLRIDFDAAKEYLNYRLREDIRTNEENPVEKYNARLASIMQIRDGQFRFRVDRTAGRLHTNVSSLMTELRNYLTVDGQQLCCVDIVASQPTLSTLLLDPRFYEMCKDGGMFSIYRIAPDICEAVPVNKITRLVESHQTEFEEYRNAVDADLYNFMCSKLEPMTGRAWDSRRELKNVVFTTLYSDNRFIAQPAAYPKRLFRELFPAVYELFSLYKSADARNLPVLLQRIEAHLVLDGVCKRLGKTYRAMPMYSVHDAVAVPSGSKQVVIDIMKQESERLLGRAIQVKTDLWCPQHFSLAGYRESQEAIAS